MARARAPKDAHCYRVVRFQATDVRCVFERFQQAVSQAVAEVEARQAEKNKQLVADLERRNDETLRSVRWMTSESEADRKRAQTTRRMAMYVQPSESGEVK